jgi:hypothetical protein
MLLHDPLLSNEISSATRLDSAFREASIFATVYVPGFDFVQKMM